MHKTIGLLAHVDAGKTTFSEQLLYHTNGIRQRGRVDHKDAFLDNHPIEKQRGITIFSDQATFTYNDSTYHLIDTPGHVDFSTEMERAIQVMDYAIILLSAVEGVQGHTETIWNLLKQYQIPTFFFLNKTDRDGADPLCVIDDIQTNLTENTYDFTHSFQKNKMTDDLIEFVAERNETLFDHYMNEGFDQALWKKTLKEMITERKIFPCFTGSALKDKGIVEFIDVFDDLTETNNNENEAFAGRVYKVRHDEKGNRLTFIKALKGTLNVRDTITNESVTDKVTQIRLYNGSKFTNVESVVAGELFAVVGLTHAAVGDGVGAFNEKVNKAVLVPTLKSRVNFDCSTIHFNDIVHCFNLLGAEDPALHTYWDEHMQELHIHVMGVIQLEVLQQVVKERFGFDVTFSDPKILYKETIMTTAIGYGHFEPLKHYAEVHLKLEPAERNSGLHFETICHADDLSIGNQNLIQHHLFEREHNGLLTGSPITDMKVTLLTGRAHNKHTSGGDFREATYRALRQGLEQTETCLLEPYYKFKIKADLNVMGKLLTHIQQASGTFLPPEVTEHNVTITGRVPVATFMHYPTTFASLTQGKGALTLKYDGYDLCHNPEVVIERMGYDKDADPLYSSSSIFCAKGQGYKVPWQHAKEHMHCPVQDK